ncbi:MAG TPA: cyclic pyranopterin monophosphate synthase MoaC [Myxococcales bacterium]|jgi:cyclic pyranopterin phosphate synthase|nr:cyclic pyranopterin monophosphate synthase MoaC [Myxococcales bacterium]
MIDVSEKERTSRVAVARAELRCSREALKLLNEGRLEKGDALAAARIAGVMAAKRTPDFLPLCHPIALSGADVEVAADEKEGLVRIEARVHAIERTGVEMEALCAAAAAALTVYDMVKRHDRGMELISLRLVHKSGGRTGEWNRSGEELGIGTLVAAALTPPAQPPGSPAGNSNRTQGPDITPARGSRKVNR